MHYFVLIWNRLTRLTTMLLLAFTFTLPLSTIAQDTTGEDSTVIYPAGYFDQWGPRTAQDMLDRIPGQANTGGPGGPNSGNPTAGGRGLGSGSGGTEVLINGKRTAGKTNQAGGLLRRIAVDQVQEIQIIRGTSGELDVRGSGQVINVVLFEELASQSVSWDTSATMAQDGEFIPAGSVAVNGQRGEFNYLFTLRSNPRYRHSVTHERSILADFARNDVISEHRINDSDNNEISMNLGYNISANSSTRINALYAAQDSPTQVSRITNNLRTTPNTLTTEKEDNPSNRDNWEVGGDYELTLSSGSRFKLLGIANQNNQNSTRERFLLQDEEFQNNLFLNNDRIIQERILRASYTMDLFSKQNIEFGAERAQTILDSKLALGLFSSTGTPSATVGGLIPQKISNANSIVEEIRYEPFFIHNWKISTNTSLESTIIYESSEISQTGDITRKRDFNFIKPKLDLRYDLTPMLQLRGTIERLINQLNFADFVAANDEQDNDRNLVAGNAGLRQQTQWRYSFKTEYRLPNDVGVMSGELFYADHQDVIDRIDVSPSDDNLQSANGNIGDGTEYGLDLKASIRMSMIGLPNLLVSPSFIVQDSQVTDPFLGIERRFQSYLRGQWRLTMRHDIPKWRFNWGLQNFDRVDGGLFRYDVDDIEFDIGDPFYNLFAEYVDNRGLTYRVDVQNVSNNVRCRRRTRFVGRISDNVLEEIEGQCSNTGVELSFKVTGNF